MMVCGRTYFFFGIAQCALALSGISLFGQEKPDNPEPKVQASSQDATSSTASLTTPQTDKKDREARDEVPKRIFWIIPNFMTTNDQPENEGPLTSAQKYNIAWHQFWDESAHFGNIFQAGISQAADGIPHYGEGWGAFGERYLAQEGDQFTGAFLIYWILLNMLHQDPRYFRRGRGSALTRIAYAASRVLIARSDSGNPTFNASQVFGQLGQAGISLSYYPKQDRNGHGLLVGWAVNQTYNVGWNQLKEFTPDLNAFIQRQHKKKKHEVPADPRATPAVTGTN